MQAPQVYFFGIKGAQKSHTRSKRGLRVEINYGPQRRSRGIDLLNVGTKVASQIFLGNRNIDSSLKQFRYGLLAAFQMLHARDEYTAIHSICVAAQAFLLGEKMGLSPLELTILKLAGLSHDFGKIGVGDKVLNKPGELDPVEKDEMNKHPVLSVPPVASLICGWKPKPAFLLLEAVKYHQRRFDGGGYPDLEKGMKQLSLLSFIMAMADSFDAMTSRRIFITGKPTLAEKIKDIDKNRNKQFHPDVADVCLALIKNGISVWTEIPIPSTNITQRFALT